MLLCWNTIHSLQWRHNESDGVSNHEPHDCLLNCVFSRRSKKTSKFRVTGLCEGNSPVTDEYPAQRASNAENVSIWWRHHVRWPRVCNSCYALTAHIHRFSGCNIREPVVMYFVTSRKKCYQHGSKQYARCAYVTGFTTGRLKWEFL